MAELANIVATDGNAANGIVVWWRLEGDVRISALRDWWAAAGLDPAALPSPPTALVALKRALKSFLSEKSTALVEPIDGEVKGAGYQVLEKGTDARGRTAYNVAWEARVTVDEATQNASLVLSCIDGSAFNVDDAEWLTLEFERGLSVLTATDISSWLARAVVKHDAVPLRDNGGVYFIPAVTMDQWRALVAAVENASSHRLWELPVLRSERAVEALVAAFVAEMSGEVGRINDALDGNLGKRALATRAATAEEMAQKVARFEEALGAHMGDMRTVLEGLQARIVEATLVCNAEEE